MPNYKFGKESRDILATLDPRLQQLCKVTITRIDIKLLSGYRGKEEQNQLFREGASTKKFPNSKHNVSPSLAVDLAPYPVDWDDRDRFILVAGMIFAFAWSQGIPIRWGGDWNMNDVVKDEKFQDLGHFELML